MAVNDKNQAGRTEPRMGGRIDIVEDEDFSLLLDVGDGAPAKEQAPAPKAAPASAPQAAQAASRPDSVQAEPADVVRPPREARPQEVIDVPDDRVTLSASADAPAVAPASKPAPANDAAEPPVFAPQTGEAAATAESAPAKGSQAGASAESSANPFSPPAGGLRLPLIGRHGQQKQLRILIFTLAGALLFAGLLLWVNAVYDGIAAQQTQVASDALMHSQRLGKAAPNAMQGNPEAFRQLEESRKDINLALDQMARGGTYQGMTIAPPSSVVQAMVKEARKVWERSDHAAESILKTRKELTALGVTLTKLNGATPGLLDLTEQIASGKVQGGAPAREISAASQLSLLTQRLARSANELVSASGISAETAFLLGKDVNTFRDIVDGFLRGSETLRLAPTKEGELRQSLFKLQSQFDEYRTGVAGILANMPRFVSAKQSEQLIFAENEQLRQRFADLQQLQRAEQDSLHWSAWLLGLSLLTALAASGGIAALLLQESRQRATEAEARRHSAEQQREEAARQEAEVRELNERTQQAILRLMDELQQVADGDLTVQASVTEDITGAIADSINFTVEELRSLVARVSAAADQLAAASSQAQATSNALLAETHQQARDIGAAGQAVLAMAGQITDVSRAALESAEVAHASVEAAQLGSRAVGNAIAGMQEIRGHIQETAKRIKRLGESSQEIGEITELISDITEQTNVLALNAAIQAASAGEAGRGFSIVAEEVQRLAERSAAATKQIGTLVRAIQGDTLDAIAAMERSTQGVVEGARLSDGAGAALAEILRVSNRLAELIQGIAASTEQQATSANGVAQSIQHILGVTEHTQEGTQRTAASIRELAQLATELKESVARFRVAD